MSVLLRLQQIGSRSVIQRAMANAVEFSKSIDCPRSCKCSSQQSNNHEAVCTGRELHYIPLFSENIHDVRMNGTNLTYIGENGFINLTKIILKKQQLGASNVIAENKQDEGIKLCINHRNFEVGDSIIANINKYLEKSWKVVVILSNEFSKSEWCQWEVDVVQERRRRYGRDVFLLITLKTIDSKHMTNQLRALLDSAPSLRYQAGVGEDLFWAAAIETLKKPLKQLPTALF
ncbi:unnamed protein product [Mytilus coruscus]|uniref:TIR domain-containing protein n=1 Tax=Mytilus coruscus TaxID=42192 RepID=A0A6J8A752_MYTCO|nr:unnamed protein product [Mytilus coruscus]